jgi:signal transduction histidine kinase
VPHSKTEDPQDGQVFAWLVRLRWVAIAGVVFVLFLAGPVFGALPQGVSAHLAGPALALFVYNAFLQALGPDRSGPLGHLLTQFIIDCSVLALLVHFSGGLENPFLPLFVLHVVNAQIVLPRPLATLVLGVACTLIAGLAWGEGQGLLTHHCLRLDGAKCLAAPLSLNAMATVGGVVLTLIASAFFTRSLTTRLRASEEIRGATVDALVTEKLKLAGAHDDIETERSRLQAVIECMVDAVVYFDPTGRVLLANRSQEQLWQSLPILDPESQDQEAEIRSSLAKIARSVAKGDAPFTDLSYPRADAKFEARFSMVRTDDGEAIGLVGVARNITGRLHLEHRLAQEERMNVVGKLAAGVAHEINNPIAVVSLYSQHALAELAPNSEVREHLETIKRNADSCKKIIGELLNLARRPSPEQKDVDLIALCHDVSQSVAPIGESTGVGVVVDAGPEKEGPVTMRGDPGQLRQAVFNLVINAIEASSDGDVVSLKAGKAMDQGEAFCTVAITDTGSGIPLKVREKIFQPFFTTKASGTGLGMSVAQNIVASHGGRIEIESGHPAGTVFRLIMPKTRDPGDHMASLPGPRSWW